MDLLILYCYSLRSKKLKMSDFFVACLFTENFQSQYAHTEALPLSSMPLPLHGLRWSVLCFVTLSIAQRYPLTRLRGVVVQCVKKKKLLSCSAALYVHEYKSVLFRVRMRSMPALRFTFNYREENSNSTRFHTTRYVLSNVGEIGHSMRMRQNCPGDEASCTTELFHIR